MLHDDESRRHESKAGFVVRTGTTPSRFVLDALAERDGPIRQTDLVESTGLARSSVASVVADLEDRGRVSRFHGGDGNIVFLADDAPDSLKPDT